LPSSAKEKSEEAMLSRVPGTQGYASCRCPMRKVGLCLHFETILTDKLSEKKDTQPGLQSLKHSESHTKKHKITIVTVKSIGSYSSLTEKDFDFSSTHKL
jgi:hypothetical protein